MENLFGFLQAFRDGYCFLQNEAAWNGLTFYSEGGSYAPYLMPMLNDLVNISDDEVFYLTSDEKDPCYIDPPRNVTPYFIGRGSMRTFVLNTMRTKVLTMTMPDLETFHIKRSPNVKHYNYFHHSLLSNHMVYRTGAFDHFDSVMCVGPYHIAETREWEKIKDLPSKTLYQHGSPPLDKLIQLAEELRTKGTRPKNVQTRVLVAPSWGAKGIMENYGLKLISKLISAGYFVHLRPHPRTRMLAPKVIRDICNTFKRNSNFEIGEDISCHDALVDSDIMISDWSGVAMEFAFGLGRPVLFIDVPRKVNNPEYTLLSMDPIEVWYRKKVGAIVAPENLDELPSKIDQLVLNTDKIRRKANVLCNELFFNIGTSGRRGAEILLEIKNSSEDNKQKF